MARFCFNANRKDAMDFLRTFYERVDVDFEIDQVSSDESCIILKDKRDKDIFMNLSERLSGVDGFSQPSYVPKWKTIRHMGPYLSQYEKEPYLGSVLIDNTGQRRHYKLSHEGEKAAFLYAALLASPARDQYRTDQTFIDNYWNDLKTYMDKDQPFVNFDNIDWRDVVAKYKKRCKMVSVGDTKYKHGFVEVDGQLFTATPFAADDMSIYFGENDKDARRGRIRRAITTADVTLNLSSDAKQAIPNISEFKEVVYKPGVKWAAKWNQPITGRTKYMDIFFSNPTEEEFVENFIEMYDSDVESGSGGYGDDSDDEGDERDYGDDDESSDERASLASGLRLDEDDLFGDIGDLSDDDEAPTAVGGDLSVRISELERRRMAAAYAESIPREEQPDFNNLDEEEMDLPFSYIVPPKTQWEYVLDACNSGFGVVGNLGKVSNAVLQLVADGAAMAVRDGTARVLEVNDAFMRYAEQRGV
jgi:hypothetical protein